jgi:hypothetical protein
MKLAALLCLVGCGGITADHPLTIPLGLDRTQADAQLKHHRFCHPGVDGPRPATETYRRCDAAGVNWGETWVVATYEGNTLVELRRYERIDDDKRALERWNQLVGARSQIRPASADAAKALNEKGGEAGTKSLQAFPVDDTTVVGVYLLDPSPPENAQILELVVRVR